MHKFASLGFAGFLLLATVARADEPVRADDPTAADDPSCYEHTVPSVEPPVVDTPVETPLIETPVDQGLLQRLARYTQLAVKHRVNGLASYYSTFFDGRKTANGEIYRNAKFSAAHLTLPLGTWVEVTSRATGRKLRLRVNDRGPYAKKFCLDLSQAAARFLGVDTAPDRHVDVRIIALPGEEPIPENVDLAALNASAPEPAPASVGSLAEGSSH
jgi:rare lipoprotein A